MLRVIPQPKKYELTGGRVFPGGIARNDGFEAPAAYEDYRRRVSAVGGDTPVECLRDASLAPGAYAVRCAGAISLFASDEVGMHHALATLFQLAAASPDGGLDGVYIEDAADFEYRGIMIDVARIMHPVENLLSYVDLCWFYKLSHLHIHFTDHDSYTLPCEAFPKLPTEGRHYTKEEIARLCEYAHSRCVSVMPEIDVPGHCFPFTGAYPEIFMSGDATYIIAFTKKAFDALGLIFTELCEMFPYSDRIHIGGDETASEGWLGSKENLEYAAECGVVIDGDARLSAQRILATFVRKISDVVLSHGKTPVCWEGFAKEVNYLVPRTTEIFSWENLYQLTPELIAGGYRIINGSWVPNYVVYPDQNRMWSVKEIFDWTPSRFEALSGRSPYYKNPYTAPKYDNLIGGQLLSWGDNGAHAEDKEAHLAGERAALFERAPAVAEGVWNGEKKVSFSEFESARAALAAVIAAL